jgi:CheY-like chemotaxis protein
MNQTAHDLNTPMVLIVDDDPESLLLVSTMVEYVGYRPVTATAFDEASALLSQKPAALVLDLVMPDQTSERLVALLQETKNPIPVVLMSAAMRDRLGAQAAEYARLGINVVSTLAKPFWVDVLVTALEKAIPDAAEGAIASS